MTNEVEKTVDLEQVKHVQKIYNEVYKGTRSSQTDSGIVASALCLIDALNEISKNIITEITKISETLDAINIRLAAKSEPNINHIEVRKSKVKDTIIDAPMGNQNSISKPY